VSRFKSKHYDIIIIGGGMCGGALALEMHALGLKAAIIEMQPPHTGATQPERVIALSYGSRCHFDSLGVWKDIDALGVAPIKQISVNEADNRGCVQLHHSEANIDALGYVVQNAHVLKGVYAHLEGKVDMYCPASVQSISLEDDAAHVCIRDAKGEKSLQGSLLVAADGTNSQIRSMAGIGTFGWDHNRFGIVASVRPEKPHEFTAFECFRSSGPLALLPLDEKRFSIVWTLKPEEASRTLSMPDIMFLRRLSRAIGADLRGRLGDMVETGSRACFPFELRQAKSRTAKRLALIGNAAHTLHPVAGQGLNLGMRDVRTLADAVGSAVRGKRDVGAMIVLEAYEGGRRADNASVIGFTEGLNAVFNNELAPVKFARGWGLEGLQQLPNVKDWLLRHAAGLSQMQT